MSVIRLAFLSGVVAVAAPVAAQAQAGPEFSGSVSLSYSNTDIDPGFPYPDVDLKSTSIDLETDIAFASGFGVGLDFGLVMGSLGRAGDPFDIDIDLIGFAIEPVYDFGNGVYAGVYYRLGDTDVSLSMIPGLNIGIDSESYGIFAGYENGPLWVEGFIGVSDAEPGLPGDIDIRDYGVAMSYDINAQMEVFGSVVRTSVDTPGPELDLTGLSLGAEYDFGNGLAMYGSVGRLNIDLNAPVSFAATGMTVGVAYDLAQTGMGPMTLNAEYTRTSVDLDGVLPDWELNRWSIGVTIPLGGGSSEPLNSNTRTARGDYRSAVAALANSL
jgi:predicted porin